MKKYLSLLKYEWRTIIRDPMQIFLMAFPFILVLMGVYLFPMILGTVDGAQDDAMRVVTLILLLMLMAIGTFMVGSMGSFLLLEHKDEKTMNTIAVTPIGSSGYLTFKTVYLYVLAVVSIIIVLLGTKLLAAEKYLIGGISLFERISVWHILAFSAVSGLFAPALALFQGALAKNKVEGFALMKGMGIMAMIPLLMLLNAFSGGLQYVLGIFPNFWSLKAMMIQLYPASTDANLSFTLYMLIGFVYSLAIVALSYRAFLKKVQF
jgi:fluoroquinolone transport system permease protein